MSKLSLLSTEVSHYRALLLGGSSVSQVLKKLQTWYYSIPHRGQARVPQSILTWALELKALLLESIPLGSPVNHLLSELQPMIRREERLEEKLKAFERQFAFQGALAVIFPWAVLGISLSFEANFFTYAGIGLQITGVVIFSIILRRALKLKASEISWLFQFCIKLWMRVSSGAQLLTSVEKILDSKSEINQKQVKNVYSSLDAVVNSHWRQWLVSVKSGALHEGVEFEWPESMPKSKEFSSVLFSILKTGAPGVQILKDYTSQIEEERAFILEDRLALVPTQLTLVLCIFFTPALFFILIGALWPTLSVMM